MNLKSCPPSLKVTKLTFQSLVLMSLLALPDLSRASGLTNLQALPSLYLPTSTGSVSISLTNYIRNDLYTNADLIRVTTSLSDTNGNPLGFTIQLFPTNAPETVTNFLAYVDDKAYENTLIHRSVPGFIIQAGGYTYGGTASNWNMVMPVFTNITPSEAGNGLSNVRGTIAMALVGTNSNSATDQWFINLTNNSSILDTTNNVGNPPFTVFAQVVGNGMQVVDTIAGLHRYHDVVTSTNPIYPLGSWLQTYMQFTSSSPFYDMPLYGITTNSSSLQLANLVYFSHVTHQVPFEAESYDTNSYVVGISNSVLTITYTGGTNLPAHPVNVSVAAYDTNGEAAHSSFQVWDQTNVVPKVDYITQISYTNSSVFNYLYYPALPDGSLIKDVRFSWTPGLLNKSNNYVITGTGTLTVTAVSQPTFFYQGTTNVFKIHIGRDQSITFSDIATNSSNTIEFTTNPIALDATSDSKLPVGFSVTSNSPGRISGSNLFLSGIGTVSVIANQLGNSNYLAASPVTNSFTVIQGSQSITFPQIANQVQKTLIALPPAVPLKALSSSGLPVTYRVVSSNAAYLLITNGTAQALSTGTFQIEASQTGNSNFLAAAPVTNTFVSKLSQSLTPLQKIAPRTFTNPYASFTISQLPTTTSQTATNIVLSASPSNLATVSSNSLVTIIGAGTVTLTATQPGDQYYLPASVSTTFIVAKASQKIALIVPITTKTNGIAGFSVPIPLTSSGLPVTLRASGAGYSTQNDSNNILVQLTNSGKVTLVATQSGNSNYLAAIPVTNSFVVTKGNQAISFPSMGTHHFPEAFQLNATATPSQLPISYTITSGANFAQLYNTNWIRITTGLVPNGIGTVTVVAKQAGSTGYNAAIPVTNSFTVVTPP